jgi:hypothetical protein
VSRVALAYSKSVEGLLNGQIFSVIWSLLTLPSAAYTQL